MINRQSSQEINLYLKFSTGPHIISENIISSKIIICGEETIEITSDNIINLN